MPRRPTADPTLLRIGRRIAALRRDRRMSQEDLVSACARVAASRGEESTITDKPRLSHMENGRIGFTFETLTLLAEGLGVEMFELVVTDTEAGTPYERVAAQIHKLSDREAADLLEDLQSRPNPRAMLPTPRRRKR